MRILLRLLHLYSRVVFSRQTFNTKSNVGTETNWPNVTKKKIGSPEVTGLYYIFTVNKRLREKSPLVLCKHFQKVPHSSVYSVCSNPGASTPTISIPRTRWILRVAKGLSDLHVKKLQPSIFWTIIAQLGQECICCCRKGRSDSRSFVSLPLLFFWIHHIAHKLLVSYVVVRMLARS